MEDTKESCKRSQEDELEVLKSIFGSDVQDLRNIQKKWKPLNIKIRLTPQKGSSGDQQTYVSTSLHISCSAKYPGFIPKIQLEDSKGLSDALLEQLLEILNKQAKELEGEVMIYELTQTVQEFLHKHNHKPRGSFYDEMKKQNEDLLKLKEDEEEQKKKQLMDELLKRKEELKNETRMRRDTMKRSMSESSPTHRTYSSSENSEHSPLYKMQNLSISDCSEHQKSDTLYFANAGRKIQKGTCIAHSDKGCIAYSGIDLESGQLFYITEWFIKYSTIESRGKNTADVVEFLERETKSLSEMRHKNIISYNFIQIVQKKDGLLIYLVQDFIFGSSVSCISSYLGWSPDGASYAARGILDALIYLHKHGITHDNLYDSTVYIDSNGTVKVTDFNLVPRLEELVSGQKQSKPDLTAFGALIESLSPTPPEEMRDFIEKCKSTRTISLTDLQEHPFLRPMLFQHNQDNNKGKELEVTKNLEKDRPHSTQLLQYSAPVITAEKSRLQTEFEVLTYLGKGAYGDVLKVRNILDNRQYAIKRIPLPAKSKQLFRKMTREVELLSRLNHENVVRYYNSWIESAIAQDDANRSLMENDEWSISHDSRRHSNRLNPRVIKQESDDSSDSSDWICMPKDNSSSDGIEFVDSNGAVTKYDDDSDDEANHTKSTKEEKNEIQYMYIQMEFCEKSTLRTAIDNNLYEDIDRLWRLFREICEGLLHIHQQGMIHRDLKPVNIFLDSRDQVKIGDFGLATTSVLALQDTTTTHSSHANSSSLTGKVGTALYVAPELATTVASKSTYNQKVDIYSLGIILFEMCSPPLSTGMERVKTILAIRSPSIILPDLMLKDPNCTQQVQLIKWLLNHDPKQRPTTEELLSSDLLPSQKLEANELQEMVRHVLANPQSRIYKHLIAKCLTQESDILTELTYHTDLMPIFPLFEYVKHKITQLFIKHGAIEVIAPLLSPMSKNVYPNTVRLMTHSGSVVTLPYDLRLPFIRHVALNGITFIRRYRIGRVYREKKVFNFHPKQIHECAFDIITPNRGNLLADAELLFIAYDIVNELPTLQQRNITFRINHTSLLRAILLYCNVPPERYNDVLDLTNDFLEDKISKFQLNSSINSILNHSSKHTSTLIDLLQVDTTIANINSSVLRTLIKGRGEAAQLAKGAIKEVEVVVMLAQSFGISCPIHINAGFGGGDNFKLKSGGIVWQMVGELKAGRHNKCTTLAAGGRYDDKIIDSQKTATNIGITFPNRDISGCGFSFALDKLVYALRLSEDDIKHSSIDVVVCVVPGSPIKEVAQTLRTFWAAGLKAGTAEAKNFNEAQDMAKDLCAKHVILLGAGGEFRVRTWEKNQFQEKKVMKHELISYLSSTMNNNTNNQILSSSTSCHTNIMNTVKTNNQLNTTSLPTLDYVFRLSEKLTTSKRRRYEGQIEQTVSPILSKFAKKEKITMIAVELGTSIVKAIVATLDPYPENLETDLMAGFNQLIEKFPKHKKALNDVYDEIYDILTDTQNPSIVGIYSIVDCYYRLLL
uniref:non-specific serine/threonine protein kinase n=1 Tax=Culicoides sonorensis TaxID=179676 RepID=A0A336LN81_CULSO